MIAFLIAAVAPAALANQVCPADAAGRQEVSPRIIVQGGLNPSPVVRQSVSPNIIVQGGIKPDADPNAALAIGPKQDDPAQPKPSAQGGQSLLAIGPKQDDPAQPRPSAEGGRSLLAIGPKQDDPAQPGRRIASAAMDDCGSAPVPVPAPH